MKQALMVPTVQKSRKNGISRGTTILCIALNRHFLSTPKTSNCFHPFRWWYGRSLCKELVIGCLWKKIWTIPLKKIAKNQNWNSKEKSCAPELIRCLLDWNNMWRACTSCYHEASQKRTDRLDSFFIEKSPIQIFHKISFLCFLLQ